MGIWEGRWLLRRGCLRKAVKHRTFHIADEGNIKRLVQIISGPVRDGMVLTVTVIPYEKKRTLPQNDRMWVLLTEISANCVDERGNRLAKESWHFKLRIEFGYIDGTIEINVGGVPTEIPRPKSSTRFTVQEMSDYQTQLEVYQIEHAEAA